MKSKGFSSVSSPESEKPITLFYSDEGFGRPISFLYSDRQGKFSIGDEAEMLLKSLEEPVAVVSVCGRARKGKSSLLNQLLGKSSGFEVLSSYSTYGHWLWNSPLWRIAPDGTSYNVLFMDTKSIDAFYSMERCNLQIISLVVLLSSTLIYNQMGSIDDVALHVLYRIVEMTEHIHLQASQGTGTTSMLELYSPVLLFLLRDFQDNHMITPKGYLEQTLRTVDPGGNCIATTGIRESIRGFFPERDCCTLVHPIIDENYLGSLDCITSERLSPEYRDGLARLKMLVLERAKPKQIGGAVMIGFILISIAKMFLHVLNGDVALPLPFSSVTSVFMHCSSGRGIKIISDEEAVCLRAYGSGEESFLSQVNSKRLDEVSKEFLENILAGSLHSFKLVCDRVNLGNGPLREMYRMCLKSMLEKKIVELMKVAAEHVARGNIANERPNEAHPTVGSSNPHCGAYITSIQYVPGREIPELYEDHLGLGGISFGL